MYDCISTNAYTDVVTSNKHVMFISRYRLTMFCSFYIMTKSIEDLEYHAPPQVAMFFSFCRRHFLTIEKSDKTS
jgi:hypothetical protein